MHATGLQTVCKLVENQYNNLPLGFHYARDADNSQLLKIVTPNMLRVGRVNKRALDGPIRMPKNRLEILARVVESYDSWFRVWADTMVPKLMFQPKWYKTSEELKLDDLVYFPRKETPLDKRWLIGAVEGLEHGRDGLIRMVDIRYKNRGEGPFEVTNRSVRRVVKLWSIEDMSLCDDLAELSKRFQEAKKVIDAQVGQGEQNPVVGDQGQHQDDVQGGAELGHVDQSDGRNDLVHDNDSLLQLGEETERADDHIDIQQPGGSNQEPQLAPQDGGPARNTRSRCSTCCCTAHHSMSAHLRQSQFGKEPSLACDVGCHRVVDLFSDMQEVEDDNKNTRVDTIDGILEAVGIDIKL